MDFFYTFDAAGVLESHFPVIPGVLDSNISDFYQRLHLTTFDVLDLLLLNTFNITVVLKYAIVHKCTFFLTHLM